MSLVSVTVHIRPTTSKKLKEIHAMQKKSYEDLISGMIVAYSVEYEKRMHEIEVAPIRKRVIKG